MSKSLGSVCMDHHRTTQGMLSACCTCLHWEAMLISYQTVKAGSCRPDYQQSLQCRQQSFNHTYRADSPNQHVLTVWAQACRHDVKATPLVLFTDGRTRMKPGLVLCRIAWAHCNVSNSKGILQQNALPGWGSTGSPARLAHNVVGFECAVCCSCSRGVLLSSFTSKHSTLISHCRNNGACKEYPTRSAES